MAQTPNHSSWDLLATFFAHCGDRRQRNASAALGLPVVLSCIAAGIIVGLLSGRMTVSSVENIERFAELDMAQLLFTCLIR